MSGWSESPASPLTPAFPVESSFTGVSSDVCAENPSPAWRSTSFTSSLSPPMSRHTGRFRCFPRRSWSAMLMPERSA